MPNFRLRTIAGGRAVWNDITRGSWASPPFASARTAAEDRMQRDRPFSLRVVRDVDGQPEPLTRQEAIEVSGVEYRFRRAEVLAEQKRKERVR